MVEVRFGNGFPYSLRANLVKRWLVVLLVMLAVVLLLSPGIIGRLTEKNIDESLSRVDLDSENISIEAETFRRGWFTSAGRHRVLLQRGMLADLVNQHGESGDTEGTPALVIDTRVDHGPVPVSSMQREQGSLRPALANAVSTLRLDRGDGELVDLPGTVYGFLGLGGNASFRFLMDAGRDVSGNTTAVWQGADLTFSTSANNLERSLKGTVAPTTIESFGVRTEFGELSIRASRDRREHTLGEGAIDLELASMIVSNPGDPAVTIGPVSVHGENRIDVGRSSGSVNVRASMEGIPRYGTVDLAVDLEIERLDADALAVILGAWATLYGVGGPVTEAELMAVYPALDREFEALAASGGRIDVTSARVELPQGDWHLELSVDVEESAADNQPFSWPAVLLNSRARLEVDLSASLYDYLVETDPQLRSAQATGMLVRRDERYEMIASLENGRLTINGAPMNIPLGMPQ